MARSRHVSAHGQPDSAINVEHRVCRDMAEMIGFARGVIADGVVNEDEAMGLMDWADNHRDIVLAWPGNVLYRRLSKIFDDYYASEEERRDLAELLRELVGGEAGMIDGQTSSSGLPLDTPPPVVEITDRVFVFTGRFAFGTRQACEEAVMRIGGWPERSVTKRTNYLVIGTFASRDWLQTSHGTKILKAVDYRDKYSYPTIVSEEHWAAHL